MCCIAGAALSSHSGLESRSHHSRGRAHQSADREAAAGNDAALERGIDRPGDEAAVPGRARLRRARAPLATARDIAGHLPPGDEQPVRDDPHRSRAA